MSSPASELTAVSERSRALLVFAILATVVLYIVPYGHTIGYPLVLLSTYAHEMGHGLAAIIVGGRFESFRMYMDGSGVAQSMGHFGRFDSAFISAGGLVGPAILGGIFFRFSARPKAARFGLFCFGLAMLISCVWVVRGWFGWFFVGSVGMFNLLVALHSAPLVSQAFVAFLGTQLALSVFSRGDYLFTDVAVTGNGSSTSPSDVAHMAEALFLPYWFWGALCGLFSVMVLIVGFASFWKATEPPTAAKELFAP